MPKAKEPSTQTVHVEMDPNDVPFREFKDNELGIDLWGLNTSAMKSMLVAHAKGTKAAGDQLWVDEQTQPLPRSVRKYLHGWRRAEALALERWDAEVLVFEDMIEAGKMVVQEIQLSHAQVLLRSSFCREVLSACYMLEKVENFTVEHQWENFSFIMGPEGWRARYHIYSPGMKAGGGPQHRPANSKNGCYLVRLYYLGAWRCVWVNDQVPVDANDSPLLPFSPLFHYTPKTGMPKISTIVSDNTVHLWPLLLCKALLKLAAPDMNLDDLTDDHEDEAMFDFNIMHALTGAVSLCFCMNPLWTMEGLWEKLTADVPAFMWDDDDDTVTSTVKTKSTKKPAAKENSVVKKGSLVYVNVCDTKSKQPYLLPGLTPALEMNAYVLMCRDVPVKKPLPEPEVPLWKHYRWIDWVKRHGLYEAYECPRTRFLKVTALMRLSHAPHLLEVRSTDSLQHIREENQQPPRKSGKETGGKSNTTVSATAVQSKDELNDWILYENIYDLIKSLNILFFPSMYEFTSATKTPPIRVSKSQAVKTTDIQGPKYEPLYLQVDSAQDIKLKIALSMVHPRVLMNCHVPVEEVVEPSYVLVEKFNWFDDIETKTPKGFVESKGYDCVEITFEPGRHFCKLWVHSRMNWQVAILSDASLLLGTRDVVMSASVNECTWTSKYLLNIGTAFAATAPTNKSALSIELHTKEFIKSYLPDLKWDSNIAGFEKTFLHWMFRQALQSVLKKKLLEQDYAIVCEPLRKFFKDPDFGMPEKPIPIKSLKELIDNEPCDCKIPEPEAEELEEELTEEAMIGEERVLKIDDYVMDQLLQSPVDPIKSQICEYATDELPCGILKAEREKVVKKHEAATIIQAYWRGTFVRKCLSCQVQFSPEVMKILTDQVFGHVECLSFLMNEFFRMYPGTKHAYSIAYALNGGYQVQNFHGSSLVSTSCKWIPFFQTTFYCHEAVKVHLDLKSTLQNCTVSLYNNDSKQPVPQAFNFHKTFDIAPNQLGYSVMGHGTLFEVSQVSFDVNWQLTVMSSTDEAFHVCDNNSVEPCKPLPLQAVLKFHVDEVFIPNRRNILGGIEFTVNSQQIVSFRAASSSPELEMIAILKTYNELDELVEVERCEGKGEIYWPYISLESNSRLSITPSGKGRQFSSRLVGSGRQKTVKHTVTLGKAKSAGKIRDLKSSDTKTYKLEIIAPYGWPLNLDQWRRVGEIRNAMKDFDSTATQKAKPKDKALSARDKDKAEKQPVPVSRPQPDDAFVELECTLPITGTNISAKRDDERVLAFLQAVKSWEAKEHGRAARGALIRKEFRDEHLETVIESKSVSRPSFNEQLFGEDYEELIPGPTPVTEESPEELEDEMEMLYLAMPPQLKDKFIPLYFLPTCIKEKTDDVILLSPEMAEAAKLNRNERIESANMRMVELQRYNELHVLGRQKRLGTLLQKVFVDGSWKLELTQVLEERDEAIAQEALARTLSLNKKKMDAKKK